MVTQKEPATSIDYNALSLSEISEIIRNEYHEHLRDKISELTALSRKIKKEHDSAEIEQIHEQLLSVFDHLAPHMLQEEKVLFPYLEYMEHMVAKGKIPRPPSFGKVKKSVATMLDDHKDSTDKLNALRELTHNYTCPQGCDEDIRHYYSELRALDENLRMHIHLENNVLFKKARLMEEGFAK